MLCFMIVHLASYRDWRVSNLAYTVARDRLLRKADGNEKE
jgi:hypothetical protein